MSGGKKVYTFFWYFENYSYSRHKNAETLMSPSFSIEQFENTNGRLWLYLNGKGDDDKGYVYVFFRRDLDTEPTSISYEISIMAANGTSTSCIQNKLSFKKGQDREFGEFFKIKEMASRIKDFSVSQDTLKICCKIWEGEGNETDTGQTSARTRIRVEKVSFSHDVENFSKLQANVKHTIKIEPRRIKVQSISSSLYITEGTCCEERVMVDICPLGADQILLECKISLSDKSGKLIECCETDNLRRAEKKNVYSFPMPLSRNAILNRKSKYLTNDKLSVLCECTFSAGIEFQVIEEIRDTKFLALVNRTDRRTSEKSAEKSSGCPGALEDIKALYIDQSLTDVVLKTKERSFPAHKVILSARSPVFKAMMTSNMAEKTTCVIRIDDLESNIVQKLLLFLYSDSTEDLHWSDVLKLYYAADKYEIGKLKNICSSFLMENLTTTNASELLVLADTHNDTDLKKTVENFILDHEQQVFGSKEWEKLMETNPILVMKAMHLKYKQNCEAM